MFGGILVECIGIKNGEDNFLGSNYVNGEWISNVFYMNMEYDYEWCFLWRGCIYYDNYDCLILFGYVNLFL